MGCGGHPGGSGWARRCHGQPVHLAYKGNHTVGLTENSFAEERHLEIWPTSWRSLRSASLFLDHFIPRFHLWQVAEPPSRHSSQASAVSPSYSQSRGLARRGLGQLALRRGARRAVRGDPPRPHRRRLVRQEAVVEPRFLTPPAGWPDTPCGATTSTIQSPRQPVGQGDQGIRARRGVSEVPGQVRIDKFVPALAPQLISPWSGVRIPPLPPAPRFGAGGLSSLGVIDMAGTVFRPALVAPLAGIALALAACAGAGDEDAGTASPVPARTSAASPTVASSSRPTGTPAASEADRAAAAAKAIIGGGGDAACTPSPETPVCIIPNLSLGTPQHGTAAFATSDYPGGGAMEFLGQTPEGEWEFWFGTKNSRTN